MSSDRMTTMLGFAACAAVPGTALSSKTSTARKTQTPHDRADLVEEHARWDMVLGLSFTAGVTGPQLMIPAAPRFVQPISGNLPISERGEALAMFSRTP